MSEFDPFPVTVHPYQSPVPGSTVAYELGNTSAKNAVVFIGGLWDGPHTVPYIRTVARHIKQAAGLDYSVFEIRMRSSFQGFGTSSLKNDVADISALVKYLRGKGKERIVLFGHSTGTQVDLLTTHTLPRILTLTPPGLHRVHKLRQEPHRARRWVRPPGPRVGPGDSRGRDAQLEGVARGGGEADCRRQA